MQHLMSVVQRVGASDAPVVIQGETGVGKEVLARQLHANSSRAGKSFLKMNCAALPPELIESELFGHERGAFTGAVQQKKGKFEQAEAGVLLLDEIGDMDLRLQSKLLQVLQDQQFYRLGGSALIRVNVRVIAATHNDLETAIARGSFRADLYYRLNVINLRVPPLRERPEDILPIFSLLIERHKRPGMPVPMISNELKSALLAHNWPGNVRELENVARKLLILGKPDLLEAELSAHKKRARPPAEPRSKEIASTTGEGLRPATSTPSNTAGDPEADAIRAALEAARWNRKTAASILGTGYKALLYKMKRLGIVDIDGPITPIDRSVPRQRTYRARAATN